MGINNYDKAGFLSALKSTKLQDFAGKQSVMLGNLSTSVSKCVDALREIQTQHNVLETKFFEEREALEAKYQKMYQPLYTKRYEIVNGVGGEKGVPDFWLTAMKNNEELAYEISKRDEGALKFLKDIKWSSIDDPKGFKLEFYFDTNPFFKNSVLTKIYHINEDGYDSVLEKAIGTEIDWYPGKCLTQKILKKKPKNGSRNAKPITKTEQCESFFNFFSPPDVPDEIDDDDDDAEELQEFENLMEQDYYIGSIIGEEIIPHAVSWYTGEAAEDEYGDSEDEYDDSEDDSEDDGEDDLDEDDDEDDVETENIKKKGGRGHAREGQQSQDERPPECNQQNDFLICLPLFLFLALICFLSFFDLHI